MCDRFGSSGAHCPFSAQLGNDIEIVVDHRNEPALITRITQVQVLPYGEVTAEYAAIEGEGDGSLAYWREAHWAFFSRECRRLGREPTLSKLPLSRIDEDWQISLWGEDEEAAEVAARKRSAFLQAHRFYGLCG